MFYFLKINIKLSGMLFIIPKEEEQFERAYLVRKKLSVPITVSSLMNFF